ncbi:MAG: hypothetical protein PXY39_13335 [archaeon]|nr:hypothetical protein [archaeon]
MRIEERKRTPPGRQQYNNFVARKTFEKNSAKRKPVFYHVIHYGVEI